jgi:FkbM family methyltransferase
MEPVPGVTGAEKFAACQAPATLQPLSYNAKLAAAYDMIPVVMESRSKSCDLFSPEFCRKFASGKTSNVPVDTSIMSTIHGFIGDCEATRPPGSPPCNAMDIGANMGTMTTNMLKAGATVTAIEPQRDLAQLVWATACLNQWSDRLTLYGNAVTHLAAEAGVVLELGNREKAGEWGFRPDGSHLKATAKTLQATKIYVEQAVGQTKHWTYVKIDTDAIDDELTGSFLQMIEAGKVEVTSFQVESPKAEVVHALQTRHGYSMYITVNPHTTFRPEPNWESSVRHACLA